MFGIPIPPIPALWYGIGAGALALLLALGVQTYRVSSAQRDAAIARQHEAEANTTAAKVNEIFAREEAAQERRRAEQTEANAKEVLGLRRERDAIETRYKNVSADRAKLSAANKRFISNAPKSDSRDLGPTMLGYFACLREQQQAERPGNTSPAPGDCRKVSLPDN